VLTMDAVDTFIADCHAALQETSPEPAPRGRTGESQEGGWDSTPADVRSIDGLDRQSIRWERPWTSLGVVESSRGLSAA
jgi:hypothetical protein